MYYKIAFYSQKELQIDKCTAICVLLNITNSAVNQLVDIMS